MTDSVPGTAKQRPGSTTELVDVLAALVAGQAAAHTSLVLTPSENILSPLARLPFVLDSYSRYFFDHLSKFGSWSFYGGLSEGDIELRVLQPLLRELAAAPHVNVQPLSGLSCMVVAMSALTTPGDTVVCVPEEAGGHMSTAGVARRLGLHPLFLPMADNYTVDLEQFARLLAEHRPALVYLDQSTQLFPLDPAPLRAAIDEYSPETLLHFDASHINGLVLAGALANPLDRGADTFGGSTHKTLPGPHKGFLATRSDGLAERINDSSAVFISHHQPAAVVSLTITLLELRDCGGAAYAATILDNAKILARALHDRGVIISAAERGFTGCHQVWARPGQPDGGVELGTRLQRAGLLVNRVGVPGVTGTALRLSVAEFTRLGGGRPETEELAAVLADAIVDDAPVDALLPRVQRLRAWLDRPRYCFDPDNLPGDLPHWLTSAIARISDLSTALPRVTA